MNDQRYCKRNGHQENELSHICISNICRPSSRFMCDQCVQENMHLHDIEFYKTFTEFVKYFQNSRLPQLEFRLQQQKGNQVKCDYLKKIHDQFSQIEEEFKDSDPKQDQACQEFHSSLAILILIIQDYINKLESEILLTEKIHDIYQQLTPNNLVNLNDDQINNLLENHCQFFEKEIDFHQQIINLINKLNSMDINNHEFLQNAFCKIKNLSIKLINLKNYMNFNIHDEFCYDHQTYRDQINDQGRNLALYDYNKIKKQDKLYIRDLISKKLVQQYFFNSFFQAKAKFDNKWKYLVSFESTKLCYYILWNQQMKLIKKIKLQEYIEDIEIISLKKIIIITCFRHQMQIIDFKGRMINFYCIFGDKIYLKLHYGLEKTIIVAIIDNIRDKTNSIFIYKEREIKPFIIRNHIRRLDCQNFEMKLFNKDSQLLTLNLFILNQWQIDYENQNLILIKTIEDRIPLCDLHQISQTELYIIKKYLDQIEIYDQNFNLWFRIQLKPQFIYPLQVHIRDQTVLYSNGSNYVVLTRARIDYEQLEQ